jgi:hypothetical protein
MIQRQQEEEEEAAYTNSAASPGARGAGLSKKRKRSSHKQPAFAEEEEDDAAMVEEEEEDGKRGYEPDDADPDGGTRRSHAHDLDRTFYEDEYASSPDPALCSSDEDEDEDDDREGGTEEHGDDDEEEEMIRGMGGFVSRKYASDYSDSNSGSCEDNEDSEGEVDASLADENSAPSPTLANHSQAYRDSPADVAEKTPTRRRKQNKNVIMDTQDD